MYHSFSVFTSIVCVASLFADRSSAFTSPSACGPVASSSFGRCDSKIRQIITSAGYGSSSSRLFSVSEESKETIPEEDIAKNDAAIRSLDKTVDEFSRRKQKIVAELEKMDKNLSTLEKVKTNYLEGMKLGIEQDKNFKESPMRSAVKAFFWRIIAGSVTFFTSLRFTKSVAVALSIVASDFFSKAFTMFVGERMMDRSKAGRKGGADDAGRSLVKALVWRLFAICNTLTMSLVIAKDLSMASKIAGSDAVFKTGLMFAYERVWANVEWGKIYFMDFII